ncbi:MAG: helix-turn-helix transcriptional regulator [Candidatus Cryptobacteroides sp.]
MFYGTMLIILALVASFWFVLKEYPATFGIIVPTCVLRRRVFKTVVVSFIALGAILASLFPVETTPVPASSLNCSAAVLSTVITVLILELAGIPSSAVAAMHGALAAILYTTAENSFSGTYLLILLFAILLVAVLSCIFYLLVRGFIRRSSMHMLKLSEYMRYSLIITVIVLSAGIGANYGSFLAGIAGKVTTAGIQAAVATTAILVLPLLILWRRAVTLSDIVAEKCEEWNTRTILAITVSISVIYILSASFRGISSFPIPPVPLVFAGIAGVEIARRRQLIGNETIVKSVGGAFLAPVIAFLISYVMLSVTGLTSGGFEDFSVLLIALAIVLVIMSASYVNAQAGKKKEMERLLFTQQNEIYENNRALNELEVKTVLNENRLLHDTLELKRKEAMNIALSICEQKDYLEKLKDIADRMPAAKTEAERDALIAELQASIRQRLSFEQEIDSFYFYAQAEAAHKDFTLRLAERFPDLTEQEKRLVTLLRLGFSSKYISSLMNVSPKSVEIGRYRLRRKLKLSKGDNLVNFLKSI